MSKARSWKKFSRSVLRFAAKSGRLLGAFCGALLLFGRTSAEDAIELRADFARTNGTLRALHGINRGPLVAGGMINVTDAQRALQIPFTRLHDAHWPNSDVVDIHAVFPDFSRDPEKAESYDFARTDEYLAAIRQTGAQIVYRLGESIEHDRMKRFVHPPKDPEKWAKICTGVIRHYNESWANGFRYDIRYWDIWNEPENRPAMWTGTDDQFLQLYATAAREIKTRFPQIKVGGPGFGYTGELKGKEFRAGGLLTNFLAFCRRASRPLDFLSWHCYADDPLELVWRAQGIRQLLDANSFAKTESHLNEWNFLPRRDWTPISKSKGTPQSRQATYAQMSGAAGGAFIVSSLIELQDAPVDMCNLFHGETGAFGLFDVNGVPEKNYYALKAFSESLKYSARVEVSHVDGVFALAGVAANSSAAVLVSNLSHAPLKLRLVPANVPWTSATRFSVRMVDATHNLEEVAGDFSAGNIFQFNLPRPSVALILLQPEK